MHSDPKKTVEDILKLADVSLNGNQDWDIKVKDEHLYKRVIRHGSLGLGEAYMDGWWECKSIDILIEKLLHAELESKIKPLEYAWSYMLSLITNRSKKSRAFTITISATTCTNACWEKAWHIRADTGKMRKILKTRNTKNLILCAKKSASRAVRRFLISGADGEVF